MRKLLFLILLIPVLSWADCRTEAPPAFFEDGTRLQYTPAQNEYYAKLHCEAHRCKEENQPNVTCLCKNFGGVKLIDPKYGFQCDGTVKNNGSRDHHVINYYTSDSHFSIEPTPTPATTTTPKVSIEDAKSQCTDIGFKTGTERFGECVLELMQ
ncbi:hypothetical protein OAO24_03935 [Methylophilaceae bacterium]|nr:hypothetical protein [Methylophilaceae bacterium]